MDNLYIDLKPYSHQSFLNIFDLVNSDGDIIYHVENYHGQKILPKDLYDIMVSSGFGIFGISSGIPELVEKMDISIIENQGNNFLVFKLAPFLGLSGNQPLDELKELKNFLIWFKEEAIKNPTNTIKLYLDRIDGVVNFGISADSIELKETLNKTLQEKIESSIVLKEWVNNQKEGYKQIEKQASDLFISMNALSLMNKEEQIEYLKNKPKNKNIFN